MENINIVNLQMFATSNTNVTTDGGMTPEMKKWYYAKILDQLRPNLVHHQFAKKVKMPSHNGKSAEFRYFDSLPKALTALTEGVTPDGQKLTAKSMTVDLKQYGAYVEMSDVLELTAMDNMINVAVDELGAQAGSTLDTVIRNVLVAGTNVQYADGSVSSRDEITQEQVLTVDMVRRAATTLRAANVPTIDGSYACIIHPNVAFDLMSDPKWVEVKANSDPTDMYEGEIGKIENVRFVTSSEAAIFVKAGATTGTSDSQKCDVYASLIFGADAYADMDLEGGNLEVIIKQLGSGGSTDPLNQRSTVAWKAHEAALILDQKRMVRIETGCTTNNHVSN